MRVTSPQSWLAHHWKVLVEFSCRDFTFPSQRFFWKRENVKLIKNDTNRSLGCSFVFDGLNQIKCAIYLKLWIWVQVEGMILKMQWPQCAPGSVSVQMRDVFFVSVQSVWSLSTSRSSQAKALSDKTTNIQTVQTINKWNKWVWKTLNAPCWQTKVVSGEWTGRRFPQGLS